MYAVDNELHSLRLTFYEEAEERLAELEESLHSLSRHGDDRDVINSIFRAVHSIKGGSAACDHVELTHFAHAFENLLSSLRKGTVSVDARLLDVLLQAKDVLDALVCAARENRPNDEQERVERSLSAIAAALARLPDATEVTPPAAEFVDLSAGFAIWGPDTEPSPAISSAPSLNPSVSARVDSVIGHEDLLSSQTILLERVPSSSSPVPRQLVLSTPRPSEAHTIPFAPRSPKTSRPKSEPRASLAVKRSTAPSSSGARALAPSPDQAIDGVVVRVGPQLYVLPTANVERVVQPEVTALRSVPKTGELLLTDFGPLPLWPLDALLGHTTRRRVSSNRVAVLLRSGGKHVALLVDEVLMQGDLTVKSLEQNVGRVRGVSGAVLFEQRLALVLECEALLAPTKPALLNPNTI